MKPKTMEKEKKIKKGTRVKHDYLGTGTAIKNIQFMTLVKWDKTPDIRYNMGENPCVIFTKDLSKLK